MPHPRTRLAIVLVAALLAVAVAGCSSGGHTAGPAAGSAPVAASGQAQIVITNFAYQPADLTVSPGQRVIVANHDSTAHTLTASGPHPFDTGKIDAGGSGTFTAPTAPGSYPYICTIHQFMHGTLTVRG